jgi:hypothetical protein
VSPALAVATAVTFVWVGMVLAISFLEAPVKFRAPEVTLRVGLGIGRLVFRALNTVEAALAVALVLTAGLGGAPRATAVAVAMAVVILVAQLALVRPRLARRSDRVLAGQSPARSRGHYVYIALEAAKVLVLIGAGTLLLAA